MGVAAGGDAVGAGLQLIAGEAVFVGVVPVEAGHILGDEVDGQNLGLAGLEQIGLGKTDQVRRSLLDAADSVGRVGVDLHDVLAGGVADVGDLDAHRHDLMGIGDDRLGRGLGDLPCKVRVGEAVAEGIEHLTVVPLVARAFLGGVHVVAGGLVVLVAEVDALAVLDVGVNGRLAFIVEVSVHGLAVLVEVLVLLAEVRPGRAVAEVLFPNFHGAAAGVDFAAEQLADGLNAVVAGVADPEDGVHAVFGSGLILSQLGDLEDVGGVDQHDDRGVGVVLLDVLDQRLLVVVQHQFVIHGIGVPVHVAGALVDSFRASAGEDDDGGVVVAVVGADGGVGIVVHRKLIAGSAQRLVHGIEVDQLGVDLEARVLHRHGQRAHLDAVGAGSAGGGTDGGGHQVDRVHAEERNAGALLQGQRVVLILEHDEAFGSDLDGQILGYELLFFKAGKVGVVLAVGAGKAVIVPGGNDGLAHRQRLTKYDGQREQQGDELQGSAMFHGYLLLSSF